MRYPFSPGSCDSLSIQPFQLVSHLCVHGSTICFTSNSGLCEYCLQAHISHFSLPQHVCMGSIVCSCQSTTWPQGVCVLVWVLFSAYAGCWDIFIFGVSASLETRGSYVLNLHVVLRWGGVILCWWGTIFTWLYFIFVRCNSLASFPGCLPLHSLDSIRDLWTARRSGRRPDISCMSSHCKVDLIMTYGDSVSVTMAMCPCTLHTLAGRDNIICGTTEKSTN